MAFVKCLVGNSKQYTLDQGYEKTLVKNLDGFDSVCGMVENNVRNYTLYDNSQAYISHAIYYKGIVSI
jgi:hypothetical protein